jgi:streptogramin lyase
MHTTEGRAQMSHRRLAGRGLASIGLLAVAAIAAAPASAVTKVVTEFTIKTPNNQPGDMAVGTDGNVWFVDQNTSKVAKISKTGAITGYLTKTANARPTGITLGPDGAMWFTEAAVNKIGRIAGPPATDYPLPAGTSPRGITVGTDGNLYFTEYTTHSVAKMDPATHVATVVAVLPGGSGPTHIVSGPDGNLWVTETLAHSIARITIPGDVITQVPLTANSAPSRIVAGPLNSLWVAEPGTNQVAQVSTAGTVTQQISVAGKPTGIAVGADGTLPDNNLWVTEPGANKIARVTTAGAVTQYAIPTAAASPGGIALGTDGNLWFSENAKNKIGMLTATPGHSSYVVVHDFGYLPPLQGIGISKKPTTLRWLFEGPNAHSVTDAYAGSFFDSGSQEPGTQFSHTFNTAGTFNYADTIGSLTGGSIKVTPQAAVGTGTNAGKLVVTVATSPLGGLTTDVQVETPSGTSFTVVGSTIATTTFVYTPAGGHGVYKFQVRTNSGANTSDWSPTARVTF